MGRSILRTLLAGGLACLAGCGVVGSTGAPASGPLFLVPLTVGGRDIGGAVIDTGGGYELLLRESFGLEIVDSANVLVFGGVESVAVTEAFDYAAGGFDTDAPGAIVNPSICQCNALGFHFLRKTGLVLGLDFGTPTVLFLWELPVGDVLIPFESGPEHLSHFDTAFVTVEVSNGPESKRVLALLDTGANATVMRAGLVGAASPLTLGRPSVTIRHSGLGAVTTGVVLFETPGLPDMIIGTDVMQAWGDQWYFLYAPRGGLISVIRDGGEPGEPQFVAAGSTARLSISPRANRYMSGYSASIGEHRESQAPAPPRE